MPIVAWLCLRRMTIDVRHLRAFLMIAEEQHLTRAATRLHLSQPALSRTLAQLERELGVQLVDRSTHHLEITADGRRFERSARKAVRAFDDALASAAASSAPLRIGQSWAVAAHLSPIVRAWTAAHPERPLVILRDEDRSAGLGSGRVDVALTRGPLTDPGLRSIVLDHEPRVAVLPADHRLASRRTLRLRDLASETLIIQSRAGTTTPELWPASRRPRTVIDVSSMDDWLVTIASGAGVGVSVASTAALHPHPDLRFISLADAAPVPLLLAWPGRGAHPATKEFVRLARSLAG